VDEGDVPRSGAAVDGAGGSSSWIAAIVANAFSRSNGRFPTRSS